MNVNSLKEKISKVHVRGGTTLTAGMEKATQQFQLLKSEDKNANRIIFLTDMIPSSGDSTCKSLFEMAQKNALNRIYTSFIGVGIDFNTDLVSLISTIRGSNYFSVKSSKDFKKQMDEEFDYMVTVNVFNVAIDLETDCWVAERVFGSPGYEIPTKGRLLFMDSTFPSPKENATMTKGGIVLVKLKKVKSGSAELKLCTSYEDENANKFSEKESIQFPEEVKSEELYENASIRKAILLTRYVNFMKHFLRDSKIPKDNKVDIVPSINFTTGITVPEFQKSSNSSASYLQPLKGAYKELFKGFIDYFEKEVDVIQDKTLEKELKQLSTIYEVSDKK